MASSKMRQALLTGLLTSLLTIPVASHAALDIISGGVGAEEAAQMNEMARGYPLKIVLTTQHHQYLSDADVTIRDSAGHILYDQTSDGPIILAKLAPGRYTITARYNNYIHTAHVVLPKSGKTRTVEAYFPIDESQDLLNEMSYDMPPIQNNVIQTQLMAPINAPLLGNDVIYSRRTINYHVAGKSCSYTEEYQYGNIIRTRRCDKS